MLTFSLFSHPRTKEHLLYWALANSRVYWLHLTPRTVCMNSCRCSHMDVKQRVGWHSIWFDFLESNRDVYCAFLSNWRTSFPAAWPCSLKHKEKKNISLTLKTCSVFPRGKLQTHSVNESSAYYWILKLLNLFKEF